MIECYGRFYDNHPAPGYENRTPCIDYLAETGLTFRNAWTNPICSPTRAQILTGKPALHSGIGMGVNTSGSFFREGLQHFHDTIPYLLRSAGYTSAAIGKWHLASVYQFPPGPGEPVHPLGSRSKRMFDLYAGPIMGNIKDHCRWWKTFATPIQPGLDECTPSPGGYCQAPIFEYTAVDTADDAIHLIETLPEPFFLYVCFNLAHKPEGKPSARPKVSSCLNGGIQGDIACAFDGQNFPRQTRCMVQWMDNEIRKIICAMESGSSVPDLPTTTIFMGDNAGLLT